MGPLEGDTYEDGDMHQTQRLALRQLQVMVVLGCG